MARNVEIKACIDSIEALLPLALDLADGPPEAIAQDDTFFTCAVGRLKLRVFADGRGELIAYARPDATGPKTSNDAITPVIEPDALRATLARALGISGRVIKRRTLLLIERPACTSTGSKGSAISWNSRRHCATARAPTAASPWRTACCERCGSMPLSWSRAHRSTCCVRPTGSRR